MTALAMRRRAMGELAADPRTPFITDSFDRADTTAGLGTADTGETWTTHSGTWGIASNLGYRTSTTDGEMTTLDAGVTDIDARVVVTVLPTAGGAPSIGLVGRYTSGVNSYYLAIVNNTGQMLLYKNVTGSFTQLGTTQAGFQAGDELGLVCNGTTIELLRNEAAVVSVTDSALASGSRVGFRAGGTTIAWRVNDFSIAAP